MRLRSYVLRCGSSGVSPYSSVDRVEDRGGGLVDRPAGEVEGRGVVLGLFGVPVHGVDVMLATRARSASRRHAPSWRRRLGGHPGALRTGCGARGVFLELPAGRLVVTELLDAGVDLLGRFVSGGVQVLPKCGDPLF
jgi:hypothetical protein